MAPKSLFPRSLDAGRCFVIRRMMGGCSHNSISARQSPPYRDWGESYNSPEYWGCLVVYSHLDHRLRTVGYSQDSAAQMGPIFIAEDSFRDRPPGSRANSRSKAALAHVSRNIDRLPVGGAGRIAPPKAVPQGLPTLLGPMEFRPRPRRRPPSLRGSANRPAQADPPPHPTHPNPVPPYSPPRPISSAQPPWGVNRPPRGIRFLYTAPSQAMRDGPDAISPRITPPRPPS